MNKRNENVKGGFTENEKFPFDEETLDKLKREIQVRSQVAEVMLEQRYQNQLRWLATPLPLQTRLKLRIKRQFRKLSKAIAAIRQ